VTSHRSNRPPRSARQPASPHRTRRDATRRAAPRVAATPHCQHFGRCGGCSLLTTPIEVQLQHKIAYVESLLQPYLGDVTLQCAVPETTPLHFRTKLLYPVRKDRQGLPILGIYAPRSHELVRIRECRTQDTGLTALGIAAERILRELRLQPYDEGDGSGFVRAFHARLAAGTGELLMGVVTRGGTFPQGALLAEKLLAAARRLPSATSKPTRAVGVVRSIGERDGNYLLGERHVPLIGRDYQEDRADGLTFRISFGSFYQIHREASELLYGPALAMCGDVTGERVVDGYGGIGTFALRLLRAGAASVDLVEENPTACRDAEHNARANGMTALRVVKSAFATAEFAPGADLLVVDPPRSGLMDAGLARVLSARPKRLLHVACSAESLARDLAWLTAAGYRVQAAQLCDMFPHTDHVELLTLLLPPA
jgi:23S rRNA (uracil1939-C5)-methyltransferase